MDIGSRIKQVRGKLSRADFAESLGIHPQTLYLYEKGKRVVDVELIQQICSKYNVSAEWLIFGEMQLQSLQVAKDLRLKEELAEKEARLAEQEERINRLKNELIAAQAGALEAYRLAMGALTPAERTNEKSGKSPTGGKS